MINIRPNDQVKVAALSLVAATDNTTIASPGVALGDYAWIMFVINTTDANADTVVNAKLQTDSTTAFSSATDVATSGITEDTAAATAQGYILQIRTDMVTNGDAYVRCLVTAGNGTSGAVTSIVALGFGADYLPGSNVATVIEVVTVD